MNLVTSLHPTASSHLCREPNTTLATGSNAVTIPFKVFFSFHPFFFFLLSIQWYAMSVCNARLFFKFSFTIKKEKKRTFGSRRFTDFFFFNLSGRFCVCDDPAAYFRFRSLYLYCVFSFPNFVFLWLYSFHPYIDENT